MFMHPRISKLALPILFALLAVLPNHSAASKASMNSPALARTYEVRLRKLHLVRPDLISYPLMLEVYC